MSRYALRPSACLLALLTAIPAIGQAADSPVISTVTSSLSNLRIELIDLAPNDGIAPSITFSGGGTLSGPSIPFYDNDGQEIPNPPIYSNSLLPSSTVTQTLDNGNTVVTASPTGIEVKSQLTYDDLVSNGYEGTHYGYLKNSAVSQGAALQWHDMNNAWANGSYTLSPNTAAVVHGTVSNAWSIDGQAIRNQLDPKYTSWTFENTGGSASVEMQMIKSTDLPDAQGNTVGSVVSSSQLYDALWTPAYMTGADPLLQSNQTTHDFEFGLVNVGAQDQIGDVYFTVSVLPNYVFNAYGDLPPITPEVPEPGTYALMGLGLVGITLVRRQRR